MTAKVSTIVAPAPAIQSQSGSGRSKRCPKPCAAASSGRPSSAAARRMDFDLGMNFEIDDRPVMARAVRMLGDRETAGDLRLECHRRGRLRRRRRLEVVAVQVQLDRPVARPAQLDAFAALHAQRLLAGDAALDEEQLEDLRCRLRGGEVSPGRDRRDRDRRDRDRGDDGARDGDGDGHAVGRPRFCHRRPRRRRCTCSLPCR